MTEILKKITAFVVKNLGALKQIHDTPHSIGGGVALGRDMGFRPLGSAQ